MGPVEALQLALDKEIEAVNLYQRFMNEYPVAKDIFSFLLGEEQKHKQLIEKEITKLTR